MDIGIRQANRLRVMNAVFDASGGSKFTPVDVYALQQRFNMEGHELADICQYLMDEGLLAQSGGLQVNPVVRRVVTALPPGSVTPEPPGYDLPKWACITHKGIIEIEGARAHPGQPTSYFPPFIVINKAGDVVTNQPQNQYNFGPIQGNVAAGSQDFTQVYHDGVCISKLREFADLIAEIADTLRLEPEERTRLEAGVIGLRAALEARSADKGRLRRALDGVMAPLKLAADTMLRNTAITLGTQLGDDLDAAIRHLSHL